MEKAQAVSALRVGLSGSRSKAGGTEKCRTSPRGWPRKSSSSARWCIGPELLILDEPLSGFDPINARRIIDVIRSLAADGTSILLSTHDMPSVERLCDHVVMLNQGKVVLSGEADVLSGVGLGWQSGCGVQGQRHGLCQCAGRGSPFGGHCADHYPGVRKARIRLREGTTAFAILGALQEAVEVQEFIKVRPTMETLFIAAVDQAQPTQTEEA